ncbi:beta-phosphoglucomutase family hydrolase [Propionibacterium sp. oral taxon 192 str. F0372]|uniref:HAD family hydrolase n=1 Tax=Propionibacterium sp. oral taxon 192 TaxID=671222 RepID=UPI000352C23B|nr:beta-phosphoglucomutase family hydrolase [Propionibacterium sp. oral taxon 192]EPH03290.1 beta-phosphoglucomutase family hydrolase [Propionibacterium sp. oral taxon 192 str. F0372]
MKWTDHEAALFDLDGVLTPTADIHMAAWSAMFNDFLASRGIEEPFTDADYYACIDGRPRYEGVATFLASRGIELPEGDPSDEPGAETIAGLGNRKNDFFIKALDSEGIDAYPGAISLVEKLADLGIPMAVVSSSRNAAPVLAEAGLTDWFEMVVDGVVAERENLAGKPDPACFLYAAEVLGIDPADAVVVEDALSGVEAGAAGGFGMVVGIDRGAGADELLAAGADLVVEDCGELL